MGTLAAAASAESIPSIDFFFRNPAVMAASISPSGEYLALVVRGQEGRYVLSVLPCAKPAASQIIAGSEIADIVSADWVNDQRLVVHTGDLSGEYQNRSLQLGLFAIDRDGGHVQRLITGDWRYTQDSAGSQIHSRVLPPKFRMIGRPHDGTSDIIVGERDFDPLDGHVRQVTPYRLDTRDGALKPLLDGAIPELGMGWLFDVDGQPRVYTGYTKDRRTVYYRDADSKNWKSIGNFNAVNGEGFVPEYLGYDGNLYVSQSDTSGYSALYRLLPREGRMDDQPLVRVEGFDFQGRVVSDPQTHKLLGIHYQSDAEGTAWLDPRFKQYQALIDKSLPATVNVISCGNCPLSKFLLVTASADRSPPRYFLFDTAAQHLVLVAESQPGSRPAQLGRRSFDHYRARDGMSIPVYVTLPPGNSATPPPAVVLVHGGPWVRGAHWEWSGQTPQAQFLATRGYAVIEPEFRGSAGYGFKLFQAGWRQWGLAMQDDLADAALWAIGKGYADPKRIAIGGASYGGYATLMGLVKNPEVFRCGFEWVGVTDIDLMYSLAWSDASDDYRAYGMPLLIGDREKDAAQLKAASPLANAARIVQPLLMAYGGEDRRVPIEHGVRLRDAVGVSNKHVEWIDYHEEGHVWYKDADNLDFWTRVEAFLRVNLKEAP